MKRLLSVLLVIGFAFSLFGGITAKGSNEDGCEITSFSYESDGNTYFVETQKYDQYAIAKLYKNGVLIQESVADPVADKLETNIYEADGSVQSTQVSTLNSVISIESNTDGKFTQPVEPGPQIEITEELLMVNPRYREPTIYSEPVDNTDLYISMSQDGLIYYLIGSASDSFAPDVVVSLHRAYTSTHLGNTKYYSWNIGTAASAISAAITLISGNLVGTVLAVLQLAAGEYLNYNASVELATFTHDYTYKGLVNGQIYYTANRNITYWRVDNITTGATQWKQKRFNYGFGGSNQDMVRMTAEIYCAAN